MDITVKDKNDSSFELVVSSTKNNLFELALFSDNVEEQYVRVDRRDFKKFIKGLEALLEGWLGK